MIETKERKNNLKVSKNWMKKSSGYAKTLEEAKFAS